MLGVNKIIFYIKEIFTLPTRYHHPFIKFRTKISCTSFNELFCCSANNKKLKCMF